MSPIVREHWRHHAAGSLVLVGAGPRALSILMRIAVNAGELAPGLRLDINVIDPYPPGRGRIWRHAQSPLLWMNSLAEDITLFTDVSVSCVGPVDDGPSLAQWAAGAGREVLHERGWYDRESPMAPTEFAPRGVQAEYLRWMWERTLDRLPGGVEVIFHNTSAVNVQDSGWPRSTQRVALADGQMLEASTIVLAQGYLEQHPTDSEATWCAVAAERGLTYIPPGYTADLDLTDLRPGDPVIVRGMGLAFVDLFVLLGEGRGGHFSGEGHDLTYHPSGREPVLYVGSRRGVPYHSKLGYDNGAPGPVNLRYLTWDAFPGDGTLDWDAQIRPVLERELADLHYRRLFTAHAERTVGAWETLEEAIASYPAASPELREQVERQVPDPADRFDLQKLDRPLTGRAWSTRADLEADVMRYVEADLSRRRSDQFSSDRAIFDGLLSIYGALAALVKSGRIRESDRVLRLEREFHGLFSYLASGPPPRRLAELLALARAGVVHFVGPDLQVDLDEDGFIATSPAVPEAVRTQAMVDARLPHPDVTRTSDPLVERLVRRGALRADTVTDPESGERIAGLLIADEECRAVRADGSVHPDRFLVGPAVSGSVGSGGFVRPGFDGPALRQNDHLARHLLTRLARATATPSTNTLTKEHRHAS